MVRNSSKASALVASACIGALLIGAGVMNAAPARAADFKEVPASRAQVQLSFAPIVKRAAPAVVNVYSQKVVKTAARRSPFADDPFFRQFFGDQALGGAPKQRVENSLGSGVIVRGNGIIVTNNHVVAGADSLRVVLADRREFSAKVLVADARTDLAVLKIETGNEKLPTVDFADTRKTEIGDMVLAIGDPFGVGQTVTSGIVSALARSNVGISDYAFFIQTDAAINPGNSGGALIDSNGDLIGINTAIYSKGGGSNGIGFAIPAEMVSRVVDNAISEGKLVRPWIGAMGQPVTQEIATNLSLAKPQGVLLSQVYPGSPADRAGLKSGDIVLSVDDQAVFDEKGIRYIAATKRAGEQVKINVLRKNQQLNLITSVTAPPESPARDKRTLKGEQPLAGAAVVNLSPAVADEIGTDPFKKGVMIMEIPNTAIAARTGFRPGDVVLEINGERISSTADLDRVTQTKPPAWMVAIERDGKRVEAQFRG